MNYSNDLVSIVVPVYNVAPYLEECVESLLKQSYRNIEILLIDDGSTDESSGICDKYGAMDARVKVFHKENGGLSDARNMGIKNAGGSYITFVDSDDWIGTDYIFFMYDSICSTGAEIAICDYKEFDENESKEQGIPPTCCQLYTNRECLKHAYNSDIHGISFISCGKLYKKDLLLNHNIWFPIGKLHEDTFTTYRILYYAFQVVFVDSIQYYYRKRSGSITNSQFTVRHLDGIDAAREACAFFAKEKEYEMQAYALKAYAKVFWTIYYRFSSEYRGSDKKQRRKEILSQFREDSRKYSKNIKLFKNKIRIYRVIAFFPVRKLIQFFI